MIYGTNLKAIIYSKGMTLTQVNAELNKINNTSYTVQNLSNKIQRETMKYTEVLQILKIIGYECDCAFFSGCKQEIASELFCFDEMKFFIGNIKK